MAARISDHLTRFSVSRSRRICVALSEQMRHEFPISESGLARLDRRTTEDARFIGDGHEKQAHTPHTSRFPSEGPLRMRTFLTVREGAFLLQRPEMVVRRMVDAGELRSLGDWQMADGRRRRRLSPESVRKHFPKDDSRELRRLAMGAILAGRLTVPRPIGRWGAPAPLQDIVDLLGAHAFHSRIKSPGATTDRTFRTINHINHRVHFTHDDQQLQ